MSGGSGRGDSSRGRGNSRRHSMTKTQRDQRSNSKNPNHPSHKSSVDNRANQLNPKNSAHNRNANSTKHSGRWGQRMDQKSASRIQSHADKTDSNHGFKERAQKAAQQNDEKNQQDKT